MIPSRCFPLLLILISFHNPKAGIRSAASLSVIPSRQRKPSSTTANTPAVLQSPPSLLSQIRHASSLTDQSSHNVTAASEACRLWSDILSSSDDDDERIPLNDPKILSLCHLLHASALARIGRDKVAVSSYERSLNLTVTVTPSSREMRERAMMGRANSLRRLLRYESAAEQFQACHEEFGTAKAASDCAACHLRVGEWEKARIVLERHCRTGSVDEAEMGGGERDDEGDEAMGMLGVMLFLDEEYSSGNDDDRNGEDRKIEGRRERAMELLRHAVASGRRKSRSSSPLYGWVLNRALLSSQTLTRVGEDGVSWEVRRRGNGNQEADEEQGEERKLFLRLATVNVGPFDDPGLVVLDDKVMLHRLLTAEDPSDDDPLAFWPRGFVLPDEAARLRNYFDDAVDEGEATECASDEESRKKNEGNTAKKWIVKDRAGYGSHGNALASTAEEAIHLACGSMSGSLEVPPQSSLSSSQLDGENDAVLCQRLVDPPLLLHGRKFSMRVYVVRFPPLDSSILDAPSSSDDRPGHELDSGRTTFVSKEGLVKLAPLPYDTSKEAASERTHNEDDDDIHMTNSGRERTTRERRFCSQEGDDDSTALQPQQQYGFHYLRQEFDRRGWDYDRLWHDIRDAIRVVMRRYDSRRHSSYKRDGRKEKWVSNPPNFDGARRLDTLGLPKILGFDFLVDGVHRKPWLVEVNRFPGLEPRGQDDEAVKFAVVEDAWNVASDRTGMKDGSLNGPSPKASKRSLDESFSLEPIQLDTKRIKGR